MRKYIALAFLALALPAFANSPPAVSVQIEFPSVNAKQEYEKKEEGNTGSFQKETANTEGWLIKKGETLSVYYYPDYPPPKNPNCYCHITFSYNADKVNLSAVGGACKSSQVEQWGGIVQLKKMISISECVGE